MKRKFKPHLWLLSQVSRIVPKRFRSEWQREWEAELIHRESILGQWQRSDRNARADLIRRSLSSFWDAVAMQPRRLEEEVMQDIRYGIRLLLQQKGIAAVAILSLALGIGANTALFSVIDSILLKKLPVRNPEELVLFNWVSPSQEVMPPSVTFDGNRTDPVTGATIWDSFSYRAFERFKANNRTLSPIFAFARLYRANVVMDGDAQVGDGQLVTGEYFAGLGVNAVLGRTIQDTDDNLAAPPVAVLGYRYWQQRFKLDPTIIGKSLKLNNVPVTVIGIAPPGFSGTLQVGDSPDLYVPMFTEHFFAAFAGNPEGESALTKPDYWWLQIMGRVRPDVGFAQVRGNMEAAFREAASEGIKEYQRITLQVVSGSQGLQSSRDAFIQPLQILMFIIGLVLLIACVNVANLLLARATAREREMVTRLSVGATRLRLLRQLVTESVLLACLGGFLGALLAYWGKDLLVNWGPWGTQEQITAKVDLRVLGFTFAISVLTGVLFGLLPAFRATRAELSSALGQHSRTISAARSRLTKSLLVVQVGMALVLLVGAGFFVQTLWKLKHVDVGFKTANLMLFKVDPSLNRYPQAQFVNTVEQIVERLQKIDGVESATASSNALIADGGNAGSLNGSEISASMLSTRWNFFDAMGVPVVAGRSFTSHDDPLAPKVVMVNEALVRRYFPNTDPIGKTVWDMEIVGVVRNTKVTSVRRETPPAVFSLYVQERPRRMTFQVRFKGDPASLISKIREVVRQVDSNVPIFEMRTMNDQINRVLSQSRLFANFGAAFGTLALFLVCVGLYGTMSYTVVRRTHEIGVRLALGANRFDVRLMVMRETLILIACGIGLGLAGTFALTQQIQSMLFGLEPNDPTTIAVAIGVMTLIAALAGYLPARRASKVDPVIALRYE